MINDTNIKVSWGNSNLQLGVLGEEDCVKCKGATWDVFIDKTQIFFQLPPITIIHNTGIKCAMKIYWRRDKLNMFSFRGLELYFAINYYKDF